MAVTIMPTSRIRNKRPCMERKIASISASPFHRGRQQITFVAQRLDELRCARIVAQLLAQAADVQVDGTVERIGLPPLREGQQLVAVERTVGAFQQHFEQAEFAAGKHDHQAGAVLQLPGGLVQRPVGEMPKCR